MKFKHGFTLEEIIEAGSRAKKNFDLNKDKLDILGEVTYFKGVKGAREIPATSGYLPAHQVTEDYLTTGAHIYFENDVVFPGETARACIKFITPEAYPNCLWVGKVININEGGNVVGTVKVQEIYNVVLQAVNQ